MVNEARTIFRVVSIKSTNFSKDLLNRNRQNLQKQAPCCFDDHAFLFASPIYTLQLALCSLHIIFTIMFFSIMSGRSVHSVLVGLVCLAIASAISCSSVGSSDDIVMCLESERQALLQFKQGLVDESNALASWKTEKECCKWRGIACNNQTGHVTSLNLSIAYDAHFNNVAFPLRGEIHPSLLELRYLEYLDLSANDFEENEIPKFIGSMSQLKVLILVNANFGGHVPPLLGNLSNLQSLDLSNNRYVSSGNLEWLSHLSSLRYLNMPGVDLSEAVNWPQSLSKLTSLRELSLSSCDLPDVNLSSSSFINSSTSLQLLDLSANNLNSSVVRWVGNVSTNIIHVDLSDNNLEGPIPNVFTGMLSLVTLDLSRNNLEGGIPKGFENLCSLESLNLWDNQFSGNIEDSIKALSCSNSTLETLYLNNNQFWGSIPELTGFSKLEEFDLSYNAVNGSLPESFGQLSRLEFVSLFMNSMNGVITEAHFLNLSRLHTLDLRGNHFSFNLSSDWSPPFQLSVLDLSDCKVGPAFPKWILTQTNLTSLSLSNAGISGSLPNKFWNLFPRLYQLDLSTNQIRGELPNLSTTSFTTLTLSSNLFSGAVPTFSPMLNGFSLSNNTFSELLPSFCASQTPYLQRIEISENLLSGELPDCWTQFQGLTVLNLGNNKLSGKIPSSLGNLKSLIFLSLKYNNFSGELPSLENSTNLVLVEVCNNNLSGKIPTWIGQSLRDMVILSLHSNAFDGILPLSLCNLGAIHVLDLSHNKISGGLPYCIGNISALANISGYAYPTVELMWKGAEIGFRSTHYMRIIDMSSNSLTGAIPPSIASMTELVSLNLSRNYLTGKLPVNFGNMEMLESLDLSRNKISGEIPTSFASLHFLSVLDLSYNNLSGRIPVSTQLQSFNASAYMRNLGLCGPPLTQNCSGNGTTQVDNKEHDTDGLISMGFFISAALGFITGFWVVCGGLMLKKSWRYAYFKILDDSRDWVYVKTAVYKAKIQRRLQKYNLKCCWHSG